MPLRTMLLSAAFTLVLTAGAHAGPPWISVELPTNPHHASTRHASMLIRAYHHSTAIAAPVTGVAEGIVDGKRTSLKLDVRSTNQTGVYAVHTPLPKGGTWIMAFTLSQGADEIATALVTVDPQGRIVGIDVPSNRTRDGWLVPRRVEKQDIEAALRSASIAHAETPASTNVAGLALMLPLLLLGGAVAVRTSRR